MFRSPVTWLTNFMCDPKEFVRILNSDFKSLLMGLSCKYEEHLENDSEISERAVCFWIALPTGAPNIQINALSN